MNRAGIVSPARSVTGMPTTRPLINGPPTRTAENPQLMFDKGFCHHGPNTPGPNNAQSSRDDVDEQDGPIAHARSYEFPSLFFSTVFWNLPGRPSPNLHNLLSTPVWPNRENISPCSKPVFQVPKSNNATPSEFFSTIKAVHFQIVGVSWTLDTGMQSSPWGDP